MSAGRFTSLVLLALAGCSSPPSPVFNSAPPDDVTTVADAVHVTDVAALPDSPSYPDLVARDVTRDVVLSADAACTAVGVMAAVERLPVDIIWAVDNSVSMAPAIEQVINGLNRFAELIETRGLDYRVVMLSLRNPTRNTTVMGSARYAVCIPRPLAGDDRCGNGPRFVHSSIDVRSTQPLEQLLGTLGQTPGYTALEQRGGEPWRAFLRSNASKTIVLVTDDQSRLGPDDFEHFRGGTNPNNGSLMLPPGILEPTWGGLFDRYIFSAIYGWGSDTDPGARCVYPDRTQPPSAGPAYTTLVGRTNGVRARICDGAVAWAPFFESVASAVLRASRVSCDLAIPPPPAGQLLDATRINVAITATTGRTLVGNVRSRAACGASGGWYYDNDARPTRVFLCPSSCERAQGSGAGVRVEFGCQTIPG